MPRAVSLADAGTLLRWMPAAGSVPCTNPFPEAIPAVWSALRRVWIMATVARKKPGAPSRFSQERADAICIRLENGASLRSICKEKGMPDQTTVYRWLDVHESFRQQYMRARERQADALFDEILDIADTCRVGQIVTIKEDGRKEIKKSDMIERARLQIDARKWLAGKLRPKVYGEPRPERDGGTQDEKAATLRQLAGTLPD